MFTSNIRWQNPCHIRHIWTDLTYLQDNRFLFLFLFLFWIRVFFCNLKLYGQRGSVKVKGAMMVKFRQLCTYIFVYLKPVHMLTFEQTLGSTNCVWSYLFINFLLGLVISVPIFPIGQISSFFPSPSNPVVRPMSVPRLAVNPLLPFADTETAWLQQTW